MRLKKGRHAERLGVVALCVGLTACTLLSDIGGLSAESNETAASETGSDSDSANSHLDVTTESGDSATLRYCAPRGDASSTRFCADFDEPDPAFEKEGWSRIEVDGGVSSIASTYAVSQPNGVCLGRHADGGDDTAELGRTLSKSPPATELSWGASVRTSTNDFVGNIVVNPSCTCIISVHGNGAAFGIEFQWYEQSVFQSSYADYDVGQNGFNRFVRIDTTLHLAEKSIDFSLDGAPAFTNAPIAIPDACATASPSVGFTIYTLSAPPAVTCYDDVTFAIE